MNILEELWYGDISPYGRDFKKGSKYSELLGYIVEHEKDMKKRLNDERKSTKASLIVPTKCTA